MVRLKAKEVGSLKIKKRKEKDKKRKVAKVLDIMGKSFPPDLWPTVWMAERHPFRLEI